MKFKLPALVLLAMTVPAQAQAHAAVLTEAEAMYLDQLVTAGAVLAQRCTGYEVNGVGGVQYGARLLGNPNAAMAMIDAFDAAIKAHDKSPYDPAKFRPEVYEAAGKAAYRVKAELVKSPEAACAAYGDSGVERGLLRRH